jgi:hypothetical protein
MSFLAGGYAEVLDALFLDPMGFLSGWSSAAATPELQLREAVTRKQRASCR